MKLICVSSYKAKQKQNENGILNLWQFCVEMSQFNGSGNSDLAEITAMWGLFAELLGAWWNLHRVRDESTSQFC
jgi:hypothetical protein